MHDEKVRREEAGRTRRGRPKVTSDEEQRRAIVAAASQLFLEEGYARTTTEAVATRCRTSKRTLYRLFPGKAELFAAIVESHRRTMLALPGDYDDLPLMDALEEIFMVGLDEEADRKRHGFVRLAVMEAAEHPELVALFHRYGPDKSITLLAEWLAHQCAIGRMKIDNTIHAAWMLMHMVFGPAIPRPFGDDPWRTADRTAYLRQCIRIFVEGVRPR